MIDVAAERDAALAQLLTAYTAEASGEPYDVEATTDAAAKYLAIQLLGRGVPPATVETMLDRMSGVRLGFTGDGDLDVQYDFADPDDEGEPDAD